MTDASQNKPEAVILPPPPRQVRGGAGVGLWLARIFMLPHTFVGIASFAFLCFLILWQVFGTTVPGSIISTAKGRANKGGDTFSFNYTYTADGKAHERSQNIDRATFDRLQDLNSLPASERQVSVKQFSLGTIHYASLPVYESEIIGILFLTIWVIVWNSVVGTFVYQLWVKPARLWALYKNGQTAPGTIVSKRMSRSRSKTCYVSYRFQDPVTGHEFTGECEAKRIPWESLAEGQRVTVIYAAGKPTRSTVFGLGDYQVSLS